MILTKPHVPTVCSTRERLLDSIYFRSPAWRDWLRTRAAYLDWSPSKLLAAAEDSAHSKHCDRKEESRCYRELAALLQHEMGPPP